MSLCDCRGLFANDKEVTRRRSGAASRDSDEVIHKKRRQACRRINQCFLKIIHSVLQCTITRLLLYLNHRQFIICNTEPDFPAGEPKSVNPFRILLIMGNRIFFQYAQ